MLWEVLWRNRNTFSLTFCLGFSLISIIWQRNPFATLAGGVGKVADRVSYVFNSGISLPGKFWVEVDKYRETEKRLAQAQKQIEEYKLEKDKFDSLVRDNERLRSAIGFAPSREYPELRAEVLGVRLDSIRSRILIGKGRADGLTAFMPVIAHAHDADQNVIRAVVGIVASVDSTTAVVEPIFHPSFKLGVRIPDSGEWALLTGNSGSINEVVLTYVTSDLKAMPANDEGKERKSHPSTPGLKNLTIVTSGGSGIFPRGIPVGQTTREGARQGDMRTAFVKPFAPIGELDYVIVILKKPETWKPRMDRDENWDDNLRTEFGTPVFQDLEIRTRPKKDKTPGTAEGREKDKEGPETTQEKHAPTDGPRKIQNVNPPGK